MCGQLRFQIGPAASKMVQDHLAHARQLFLIVQTVTLWSANEPEFSPFCDAEGEEEELIAEEVGPAFELELGVHQACLAPEVKFRFFEEGRLIEFQKSRYLPDLLGQHDCIEFW